MEVGIRVNPEYEALCPDLTPEEFESLKESIGKDGLWIPLIVNPKGIVLDGHNRLKVCNELGIKPKYEVKDFRGDPLLEMLFILKINSDRRHLTKMQRVEQGLKKIEILNKISERRKRSTIPKKGQRGFQPVSTPNVVNIKNTKEEIAKAAGVSIRTMERAKKVLEEAPEKLIGWIRDGDLSVSRAYGMINTPVARERIETILEKAPEKLLENVRKGKTSVGYAYTSIKRAEKHVNPPPLPEGEFDVIYADPPWKYAFMAISGNPEEQYSTMTFEGICNLEVDGVKIQDRIADDAILFLWSTNPLIAEAREVMEAWGFEYKTNMCWVKSGFGLGHYLRGDHELLLIGKKGDMPTPAEANRPSSVLKATKSTHSKKPEEVYEMIEKMYPNRKYLELFARPEIRRKGWTYWGDEVET